MIRIPPSRAAIVLSSSRSIAMPEVFVTTIASSTRKARVPKLRRTVAEYSAVRFMLVAFTAPGRIAATEGLRVGAGAEATAVVAEPVGRVDALAAAGVDEVGDPAVAAAPASLGAVAMASGAERAASIASPVPAQTTTTSARAPSRRLVRYRTMRESYVPSRDRSTGR